MKAFSGYLKNDLKLLQSASGGATTAISEKIIKKGGIVFGATYSEDFRKVEYCCIQDIRDLDKIKGSKYTYSIKGDTFKQISDYLKNGKTVLFIGLGCDVGAVYSYCKKSGVDISSLYTIDILCHGPAIPGVHRQYIESLEKKYNSKLNYFTIRYKKNKWTPFYILAKFQNGKEYIVPFNETDYGKAFYYVASPGCTKCRYKGENHKGDICVGDYWGMKPGMLGWNEKGVSVILTQTHKRERLLELLDDNFHIQEEDVEFVTKNNPMYYQSRIQKVDYNRFVKDLKERGLHYAVQQIPSETISISIRLKRFLKQIFLRNSV